MTVHALFTDRADDDLGCDLDAPVAAARRRRLVAHPWTWLRQVHGNTVVVVEEPGGESGAVADAAVTTSPAAVMSVQVADCAPVLMFSATRAGGVVAAAHAGWRGLLDGVLGSTIGVMRELGASQIDWLLGPCISAANYEFSEADLEPLVEAFGPEVSGRTTKGRPALDMRAAVGVAMSRQGYPRPEYVSPVCTTSEKHWSYRGEGACERQVGAIWLEPA